MFERMLMTNTGGAKAPKVIRGPLWDPVELTGVLSNGTVRASDGGVDWYGEVSASGFITGTQLASLIGLTAGTSQHSTTGWLHVGLDGTELLIAKRPLRNDVSWDHINARNAVYGNRIVKIGGVDYKIRLPKGANSDPTGTNIGWDVPHSHGSEWNRIFYRLTDEVYVDSQNTKASEEPFVHLANYTETDLLFISNFGNGSACWCQETAAGTNRVNRGYIGVSHLTRGSPSGASPNRGWRPFLEKV